ncbi:hypothetical protein [Spirosoma gilvum]
MSVLVKKTFALSLGLLSLMSCSRLVATFQSDQHERFFEKQPTPGVNHSPADGSTNWAEGLRFPSTKSLNTMDALARNDSKPIGDKVVQQRFHHSRTLLVTPLDNISLEPSKTNNPQRKTGIQRFLLKKISKRLSRRLTPDRPVKTALVEGILVLGAVLLLGGVLLVLLTSGTGFAIGVIALAAGLVCLLVGLL